MKAWILIGVLLIGSLAGMGLAQNIININTATEAELVALPSIGPKTAKEIIKHRPYRNAQELQDRVKGIGPKTWKKIQRYVRFS
jgi:competence protein ComEA